MQRADAENQHRAATHALTSLQAELAEDEKALTTCNKAVDTAAKAIVACVVEQAARELLALENECAIKRRKLMGASQMRVGGSFPLSSATISILRGDTLARFASPESGDVKFWNELHAALLCDAEAKPPQTKE